tara:strand:+ start:19770 stop:20888 length:1119 start_codon:yes stop_codon:yes gene_type:complete
MPSNKKSKSKNKLASANAAAGAPSKELPPKPKVVLAESPAASQANGGTFGAVAGDEVSSTPRPRSMNVKRAADFTSETTTVIQNLDKPVTVEDVAPAVSSTTETVAVESGATSSAPPETGKIKGKGVAFFDLDHTIIDTNSSWHWVQHEMNNGRIGASMLFTALYWFARYAAGFGAGAERAGAEAAELYAGTLASDLELEVENFFQKQMAHRRRPGCDDALAKHKQLGERCLICTTSWQHPARSAAKLFGLETDNKDVISSVMEIDESTKQLTGKIETVAYGDGKYHVTKAWAEKNNVDLQECTFYTDSYSDVLLMEHVGFPVAVNPDARLRKKAQEMKWEIVDWGIAEVKLQKKRYSYGCLNFGGSAVGPG